MSKGILKIKKATIRYCSADSIFLNKFANCFCSWLLSTLSMLPILATCAFNVVSTKSSPRRIVTENDAVTFDFGFMLAHIRTAKKLIVDGHS